MSSRLSGGGHVRANGIRQHYLRFGAAGPPLILVPGITSPAITWSFVANELAEDLVVYVLDVRGRGLSEAGNHVDYGLHACAADIAAFADALQLETPAVLGHSMGARHAIRAARHAPGRFSRLALIDPPVSGPGRRPYPAKLNWYVDSIRLAQRGAGIEALREYTPSWTDEQIAVRAEWLHTCDQAAVLSSFASFHEDDVHQDLPHLHVPLLLVAAARGDVLRDEDIAEIRALAPHIETVRVDNAGHMIPWDNLPGFLAAVRPFLTA